MTEDLFERPGPVICFGELLLRLNAPGRELILQSPRFDVHVGGAEANVAAALAQFGHPVRFVTVVPADPLGEAAVNSLRRCGVDVGFATRGEGRMGLYFMSTGAVRRPSEIVYDRAGSAFALTRSDRYDWDGLLANARCLHLSGVTPAVSAAAGEAALAAAAAANKLGVPVSFDGNYRASLWERRGETGAEPLRALLASASVAFVNERDIGLAMARDFADRASAYAAAFEAFPRLRVLAATTRAQRSVDDHDLGGEIVTRGGRTESKTLALRGVVDRIGAGDAFAAGLLHALLRGDSPQNAIDFAIAAAALKHSIPGDQLLANAEAVDAALASDSLDVRR